MSKPKLNRLPVIWLMTVVTGQGTLPNPSKMLQVRYLHLSPSLHLNTSWIGSKSFPFLIGCLREFSPKRLQLKFSKYVPDLSSNDAPLTSVRAHTKIYHQNWSPCFSTESISSTISMACLLYLQFIHMLQHCHTRPKTTRFTEKTSGLHVWLPCTTRKRRPWEPWWTQLRLTHPPYELCLIHIW